MLVLPLAGEKIIQGELEKKKKESLKYLSEHFTVYVWWKVYTVRQTGRELQAKGFFLGVRK